jgi:hypothetical protein
MTTNANGALQGGNINFGKPAVAAGTTTTISVVAATDFSIAGHMYAKAIAANGAAPTLDSITGVAFKPLSANQACIFVICLDSAGALRATQGPIVALSDVTGKLAAVHFPQVPEELCPIAYLYAQAGTTAVGTWTFGVNNMSGVTGMTYTFRDLAILPATPITA